MAVSIGVHPGGQNRYAVVALFYTGSLPALMFRTRVYSGTSEVLRDIVGTYGEWGPLAAVAIDAPLTWSGAPSGWRNCDLKLKSELPEWAPPTWVRPPNALAGAVSVQGPALAWELTQEVKNGLFSSHTIVETHPRLCLARFAPELRDDILAYGATETSAARRLGAINKIVEMLVSRDLVTVEDTPPTTRAELDALVCAIVALVTAHPHPEWSLETFEGGDIKPLGERSVSLLSASPAHAGIEREME